MANHDTTLLLVYWEIWDLIWTYSYQILVPDFGAIEILLLVFISINEMPMKKKLIHKMHLYTVFYI